MGRQHIHISRWRAKARERESAEYMKGLRYPGVSHGRFFPPLTLQKLYIASTLTGRIPPILLLGLAGNLLQQQWLQLEVTMLWTKGPLMPFMSRSYLVQRS